MSFNNPNNPYQTPQGYRPQYQGPLPQSGFGTAAFVISLVSFVIDAILMGLAMLVVSDSPGGGDESFYAVVGLGCCGSSIFNIAGVVLGIVGLVQADRRRGFAIAGLVINALLLLAVACLVLVGLVAQG